MPTGVYPRTDLHRKKISEGLIGHKGASFSHTEETKQKISNSLIGNQRSLGRIPWNKGKGISQEQKTAISKSKLNSSKTIRGPIHHFYKDGRYALWRGKEWIRIRKEIKERDNYTCQSCSKYVPKGLIVHHIVPWKISQDNSYENLISLCGSCHYYIERELLCLL